MTCLVCCSPLIARDGGQYQCPVCNYWYPAEVLTEVGPILWSRIQDQHLACTVCEQTLPGLPRLWTGRHGELIPCPVHARRVGWRRWFRLGSSKRSRSTTQAD